MMRDGGAEIPQTAAEVLRKVIIRVALPEDVVSISKLWLQFMEHNARFDSSFAVKSKIVGRFARELEQHLDDRNYRITVADVDKRLCGYCLSYISKKPYFFRLGKFGFIGELFVEESFRRHGIGAMLVDDAHGFFKRKKIQQVELLVAHGSQNTLRFWEKQGYSPLLHWMYKKEQG